MLLEIDTTQRGLVFFDFECSQEERAECEEGYKPLRKENCKECQSQRVCKLCSKCQHCKSKRKAMNRNWYNQKANPALNTKAGNK